jgi:hypothetical protein
MGDPSLEWRFFEKPCHDTQSLRIRKLVSKGKHPALRRRRVLTGESSQCATCWEYGINWRMLVKMRARGAAGPPAQIQA